MPTIAELAKKFKKEYKDDNLMLISDIKPDYVRMPTGALGLDYILAGGIPLGRIIEFSGLQHSGKAQPLDALVLSEKGYKKMGDIKLGDKVFGSDGALHIVDGVYPQGKKPVYKVTFNDNTSTECSDEHLWNVALKENKVTGKYLTDENGRISFKTISLKELIGKNLKGKYGNYLYKIPMTQPINFEKQDVSIDPYLLGCLLGDGSLHYTRASITNTDEDILKEVASILDRDYSYILSRVGSTTTYCIVPKNWEDEEYSGYYYKITYRDNTYYGMNSKLLAVVNESYPDIRSISTLRTLCLKKYNNDLYSSNESYSNFISEVLVETNPNKSYATSRDLIAENIKKLGLDVTSEYKYIPYNYLYNSTDVRLAILQGLMDTDGYVSILGEAEYQSVSEELCNNVAFLIQSLGGRCTKTSYIGKYKDSNGIVHHCKRVYSLRNIKLSPNIPLFRCLRKAKRWESKLNNSEPRYNLRAITKIEYLRDDECQCIHIDSDEHLYLTNDMIVTHNTTAACQVIAAYQREYPDKQCIYIDVEHSLDLRFQAKMTGLDLSKLWYINPNGQSGQQILDMILELQQAEDVGAIALDSLPALVPAAVMENDLTKDAGMRATMAKPLYPFCASMAGLVAAKNNLFIMINQVRDDGKTFTGIQKYKEPCGAAPAYYSSIIIRFGTRKFTLGDDMDACGAKNGEGADGFRLLFKVLKNKCGACNRGGGFLTYRYATGFDWINDLLEISLAFGFIKRLSSVTYSLVDLETGEVYQDEDGNDLTGKKAELIEYIKANAAFQKKYLAMLNRVISNEDNNYGNILDERTNAEIDAQQNAIDNQYAGGNQ